LLSFHAIVSRLQVRALRLESFRPPKKKRAESFDSALPGDSGPNSAVRKSRSRSPPQAAQAAAAAEAEALAREKRCSGDGRASRESRESRDPPSAPFDEAADARGPAWAAAWDDAGRRALAAAFAQADRENDG
jgi:hypothetical protein